MVRMLPSPANPRESIVMTELAVLMIPGCSIYRYLINRVRFYVPFQHGLGYLTWIGDTRLVMGAQDRNKTL